MDEFKDLDEFSKKIKFTLPGYEDCFFSAGDITGPSPSISWVVKGFLPSGLVGMVAATGGTGKTFFLIQLGVSVSCGLPFMGMGTGEPAKTLMILGEEARDDIHRRLSSIREYYQKNENLSDDHMKLINENLMFLSVSGKPAKLERGPATAGPTPAGTAAERNLNASIHQIIDDEEERPKLIILDPAARFFGGDENDSQAATTFIELLEAMKNKGTTVLFAHHTSKAGSEGLNQHSSRGSSAFVDGARWQLIMSGLIKGKKYFVHDKHGGKYIDDSDKWKYIQASLHKYNSFNPENKELTLIRGEDGVLSKSIAPVEEGERKDSIKRKNTSQQEKTPKFWEE